MGEDKIVRFFWDTVYKMCNNKKYKYKMCLCTLFGLSLCILCVGAVHSELGELFRHRSQ